MQACRLFKMKEQNQVRDSALSHVHPRWHDAPCVWQVENRILFRFLCTRYAGWKPIFFFAYLVNAESTMIATTLVAMLLLYISSSEYISELRSMPGRFVNSGLSRTLMTDCHMWHFASSDCVTLLIAASSTHPLTDDRQHPNIFNFGACSGLRVSSPRIHQYRSSPIELGLALRQRHIVRHQRR